MKDAGVNDPKLCYLVDDSAANIDAAQVKKPRFYLSIIITFFFSIRNLDGQRFMLQTTHQSQTTAITKLRIFMNYLKCCQSYGNLDIMK